MLVFKDFQWENLAEWTPYICIIYSYKIICIILWAKKKNRLRKRKYCYYVYILKWHQSNVGKKRPTSGYQNRFDNHNNNCAYLQVNVNDY